MGEVGYKTLAIDIETFSDVDLIKCGVYAYADSPAFEDLNIRRGPGTDYDKTGKYTGKGAFTIVEEAEGKGASLWGLLKSYQKNRDGWISLDYTERV